ncbi:MAG: hypothetical protein H3C34_25080 [Caldilineaceae bacterium]|nr:hypothetical protein [Caldilineaceae bacterium]
MFKIVHLALIVVAIVAVAVADAFLKKAASDGVLVQAFKSPWMAGATLLYLYQVVVMTYMFTRGWELSIVGSLQTALYAVIVVAASVILFKETLTWVQVVGVVLAIGGAVLVNLE